MCFLMLHLKLIPLKLKYDATSSSIHYMHSLFLLLQFYVYLFIYYNINLLLIKLIIIILAPSLFHSLIHHSVFSLDIFLFNSLLILFLKTNNSISLSSLVIKLAFLYLTLHNIKSSSSQSHWPSPFSNKISSFLFLSKNNSFYFIIFYNIIFFKYEIIFL